MMFYFVVSLLQNTCGFRVPLTRHIEHSTSAIIFRRALLYTMCPLLVNV